MTESGASVVNHDNPLLSGGIADGLLRLSWPMFVSALLQHCQSLIDLFWVGRLGSAAVAAVAIAGTVLMLLFPLVMGVSVGTVAMVSRAVGAGDLKAAGAAAWQSLLLAACCGLATGLAGAATAAGVCRLLGADATVAPLATGYLQVTFAGSFTVFLLFIASSALQGAGDTVTPMKAMVLATVLNFVLDPILIFGLGGIPRLGVAGAALATVLAQAIAAADLLTPLFRGRMTGFHLDAEARRLQPLLAWRLLWIGLPSSGQMLLRSLMSLVLMRIVAGAGTAAVAAYGIGMRYHMIVLAPAFILGNAAATMVGQNLGAGDPGRARRAAWTATGLDLALMAAAAVLFAVAARPLIALFDPSPEVVGIGTAYLRTVSPFYLFTALAIVLGRALMGAGDTVGPMVCTLIGLWGVQVPLAVWLSRILTPSTQGVWWAIAVAVTIHGLLVAAWFETGRWQKCQV